ncbi:MAG: hypothetical protein GY796_27345 [Chloroflexi bacterium]|nr:hypothetical protein [Chloroflexota bacterium]
MMEALTEVDISWLEEVKRLDRQEENICRMKQDIHRMSQDIQSVRLEGKLEGKLDVLLHLLQAKFGLLPAGFVSRLGAYAPTSTKSCR